MMSHTDKSILLVTSEFPPQPGGIGNHSYHLAKHLKLSGFDVMVIADQRSSGKQDVDFDGTLNFTVRRIPLHRFRLLMYWKRCVAVFKTIKTHPLVIATGKSPLWMVGFYSLFFNRKYVAVIHGSEVNFRNRLWRFITHSSLKQFHSVIAVSRYTQSLVAHLGLKSVTVIPNAVDPTEWELKTWAAKELKGFPKLLTVGRLSERKGQLEVIKHLPELLKKFSKLHYHCVGIATEGIRFMAVAEQLGVAQHVTFHGLKTQAELKGFYQTCDVFVMLSRPTESGDVEGFGIAILEANYFGLPAIGAKDSGIEDAILDGDSGLLIDYQDGGLFMDALQAILHDKEGFSNRAKLWAGQHMWDCIVGRYVAVIEELI